MLQVASEVPGAAELIAWFGYWPSFHDAEVFELVQQSDSSRVRLHTWEMTDQVNERVCSFV